MPMKKSRLWNVLTADDTKKPYGMTQTHEIGRMPEDSAAVKCTDRVFLVRVGGYAEVLDAESQMLSLADSYPAVHEADGFKTEISFAPGVILPTEFKDGSIVIGEEEFPVITRGIGEDILLLQIEDDELIVFDRSRFLLYACIKGEFICGYVEV